jgi:hypothetical protein
MMVADMAVAAAAADNGVDGGRRGGRVREGEGGGAMQCGGVFFVLPSLKLQS